MKAADFLRKALKALKQRATYRDENGEHSIGKTVEMFNLLTGHGLSERDGCMFMVCLKSVRSQQGNYHADDYVDMAGYAAMAGEVHGRQVMPERFLPEVQEDSEVGRLECGADSWSWADQVAWRPACYETKMVGVS